MLKRNISPIIIQSMGHFPAVLIQGARQVGKSTVLEQLKREGHLRDTISLDDLSVLQTASLDPQGFIKSLPERTGLDEIQRCPELVLALKEKMDQVKNSGQYVLTGSANILSYPGIADSLAGRIDLITLEGLSLSEHLAKQHSFFTDILDAIQDSNRLFSVLQQKAREAKALSPIENYIFYGGYPSISLKQDPYYRNRWLSSYISSYCERDVRDLSKLLDIVRFSQALERVGLQTAQMCVVKNLSNDCFIDQRTMHRYLEIMDMTYQIKLLRPFTGNLRKDLVKTPKIYVQDSAFAAHFLKIHDLSDVLKSPFLGPLFETWVYSELRKQLINYSTAKLSFYRTQEGHEIDFLLEVNNKTIGFECKASHTIQPGHLKGLRHLKKLIPDMIGFIVYFGDTVKVLGEDLYALPSLALH